MPYAVRDIINSEGGGNPRNVKRLYCSFTGMMFMDTVVELQILGTQDTDVLAEVFFQVPNPEGTKAIRNGSIVLVQP